ncbi:vanw like protein [Bacillus sp. OxB-1]|uniref:VanW family protein n=1 Tax=Bacillus sp. (strain OxB-1) TaxID=98228 RepID=UPI000582200E|nr:VanW family protein [Bacillus sp. OxB-1]BAQ11590.1 vanw like protein [Bacillus sp. OxB-1]
MNSKTFLRTFLAVLGATVFFYGFSSVGTLAYTKIVSPVKQFKENTYIGPFDVRGLDEHGAKDKLAGDFAELHGKLGAELTYQDSTVELPSELITYDVDRTVDRAVPGEENPIIAEVSQEGLRTVLDQHFSHLNWTDDDVETVSKGIESKLESGIVPVNVHITDFLDSTFGETEVASFAIEGIQFSSALEQLANEIDGTAIEFNTAFSIMEFAKMDETVTATNEDLTLLASALYGAVLRTNLDVVERNIGNALNPVVPAGFEAAINQQLGLDFVMRNPNHTPFRIKMEVTGDRIRAALVSLPLQYTYEPYVAKTEKFNPRTVRRYSASVPIGQVQHADEGRDGMEVTVNRQVLDDGTVVEDEPVSSDFYAPVPIIEVHPLQQQSDNDGTGADGDGGEIDNSEPLPDTNGSTNGSSNSSNGSGPSSSNGTSGTGSNERNSGNGSTNGTSNGASGGTGNDSNTKPGHTNGKPYVPPVDDGNRYDKGGNLIK